MCVPVSPLGKYKPTGDPCPSLYSLGACCAVGAANESERCSEPVEALGQGCGLVTIVRSAASLP